MSILLLEDVAPIRSNMHRLIVESEPRAEVTEAASFDEAIDAFNRQAFGIAFLDIDLGGDRSGIDLLEWIRAHDLMTRVIMLSGHASDALVMQCLRAGAGGYICKDLDSDDLFRRALATVFQGSVYLPAGVIGRGGFSPVSAPPSVATPDALGLTGEQFAALHYLSQGLPYRAVALAMGVEEGAVRQAYMPALFAAFAVRDRAGLLAELARRSLIIPLPEALQPIPQ